MEVLDDKMSDEMTQLLQNGGISSETETTVKSKKSHDEAHSTR